jgi:hypothetical protein
VIWAVDNLRSERKSTECAEPILILRSDAAIERRVIEFGYEQKYRRGLEDDADASKRRDAAMRGREMPAKAPMGPSGERRCQSTSGHTFRVARTFAVESRLSITRSFLGWEFDARVRCLGTREM